MEYDLDSVNAKIQIFSDRLRALRNKKGISAREMSLALGQNVNYINLIENGKRKPSLDMFLYICEYLNVVPEFFFEPEKNYSDDEANLTPDKTFSSLSDKQKKLLADFIKSITEK